MKTNILTSAILSVVTVLAAALLVATPTRLQAQAEPAGIGPGSYIQAGATFSGYKIDYGERKLGGAAFFVDAHLYRRTGIEAEMRALTLNEDEGVHATTYLVGPRFSFLAHNIRPYTKFLVGTGKFYYPFHYATGTYFVIAPGAGLDWHIRHSPLTVRVIDVELQKWPNFTFGNLKPYGVSTGIAVRLF